MLLDGMCNTIAEERSTLFEIASRKEMIGKGFIVGDKLLTKEPPGVVTRNDDREFSDVIYWVVQALFYGEEQGLTKDLDLCRNYTTASVDVRDLIFLNAVYCVGNYRELAFSSSDSPSRRGMNSINDGSTGMLYATSFGGLNSEYGIKPSAVLSRIRAEKEKINCGVIVPDEYIGDIETARGLVGMSVDYCRALAAALFKGDFEAVEISTFTEDEHLPFAALSNGTIDVIAGAKVGLANDFAGVHFSPPYYYGNGTER